MDEIEHRYVEVKGLKLHVAEIGSGQSVVVFLHGFPEIWYSWRHQMIAVSNAGYRAIAPDYRGYGLSDPPAEPENAAFGDLITDLLAILDALSIPKRNAEATVRRQAYTPVVLKSPRLEIAPITQGAPERMLLAVPKVESTKSWKDALLSPATQGAPERKLLAVPKVTGVTKKVTLLPKVTGVTKKVTLLQKAESLRKITEDYVKASKQYAIVRATARTKSFLIQAKEANQLATTTFVAASTGATKNVVAQLLKRVEDSIKMVEFAQKKASVENMAIIRAIGRRVMTQTSVDEKKAPVVEKTVDAYKPIVLFRAQNRSNQISVNSQEPKEHPLAQQGSNKEHPQRVFLVAKDFGAWPAYYFALLYPERVLGIITMGVPFLPPGSTTFDKHLPEGFYISRWRVCKLKVQRPPQPKPMNWANGRGFETSELVDGNLGEPGRAEADFGSLDAKTVVRNVYILFSKSEIPIAGENQEIMDLVEPSTPLPPWFTEEDLEAYGALYTKSGFCTALQVPYRSLGEEFKLPNTKVEGPALLIMGEKDYVFKFPGIEDYIRSGQVKTFVPDLEITYLPEGTHFVQEQFPDQVNQLILTFLSKHS
ncbi:unnamed protein product [Camellia sinensis]